MSFPVIPYDEHRVFHFSVKSIHVTAFPNARKTQEGAQIALYF